MANRGFECSTQTSFIVQRKGTIKTTTLSRIGVKLSPGFFICFIKKSKVVRDLVDGWVVGCEALVEVCFQNPMSLKPNRLVASRVRVRKVDLSSLLLCVSLH